ncbi:MAG: hypothetical protein ACYC4L_21125 [Chloroflexota bacterium]
MFYEKLRDRLGVVLAFGRQQERPAEGESPAATLEIPLFPTAEELDLYLRARQHRSGPRPETCAHGVCV